MILQQEDDRRDRVAIPSDYHYLDNFDHAIQNTKNFGLPTPQFATDVNFLPDLDLLYERVSETVYIEEHSQEKRIYPRASNCIWYARIVCASLEKFYKRPMMLTSGYLLGNKHKIFYSPLDALETRLRDKKAGLIHLHAWVTLPDFTVVDATLIPALHAIGAKDIGLTQDIFIRNVRAQSAEQEFCYQPVLVGPSYWEKANIKPVPVG
jgi:hypothetical protein